MKYSFDWLWACRMKEKNNMKEFAYADDSNNEPLQSVQQAQTEGFMHRDVNEIIRLSEECRILKDQRDQLRLLIYKTVKEHLQELNSLLASFSELKELHKATLLPQADREVRIVRAALAEAAQHFSSGRCDFSDADIKAIILKVT